VNYKAEFRKGGRVTAWENSRSLDYASAESQNRRLEKRADAALGMTIHTEAKSE
jgi:hypothetical protein